MFFVEKTGKGTYEYLIKCEKNHTGVKQVNNERLAKYLDEDKEHFKATLTGGMAEELGLEYSEEILKSLMIAECPAALRNKVDYNLRSGKDFINKTKNQQIGTDLLSTVSKSVSMEFALSDYEGKKKIVEAMRETDVEIQKMLALKVKPSCKKEKYANFNPEKTKILVANFTHYEDRQIDPHLHNHGILMNYAVFTFDKVKEDGTIEEVKKVLALDTKEIFKTQKEISSFYDTIINGKLRSKGYKTEYAETKDGFKTFRLCGYTEEQEEKVSKRGADIKKYVKDGKKKGFFQHF